jgi:hypothetical protein
LALVQCSIASRTKKESSGLLIVCYLLNLRLHCCGACISPTSLHMLHPRAGRPGKLCTSTILGSIQIHTHPMFPHSPLSLFFTTTSPSPDLAPSSPPCRPPVGVYVCPSSRGFLLHLDSYFIVWLFRLAICGTTRLALDRVSCQYVSRCRPTRLSRFFSAAQFLVPLSTSPSLV